MHMIMRLYTEKSMPLSYKTIHLQRLILQFVSTLELTEMEQYVCSSAFDQLEVVTHFECPPCSEKS